MNPLDALSPTIVAQFAHPEAPTPSARAKYRGQVRREVLGCTSCELHKLSGSAPVPFSAPASGVRFVVVGEAPGPEEAKRGRPFVGPSGKLLRVLMKEAGIDPERDALWANSVSCFPNVEGKVRAPNKTESLACRGNLLSQVEAGYVPFVLVVGGRALDSFRSDLTVTNHHGQFYVWNDLYVVMPIIHPAAVLRGQTGFKSLIREDLKRWWDVVSGSDDPLKFLGEDCFKCGGVGVWWDRDGVPMCQKHWDRYKGVWKKEREKWGQPANVQLTF